MKMKSAITLLLAGITMLSAFSPVASAVTKDDIYYTGELNNYYYSEEDAAASEGSSRTYVADNVSYDIESGLYYFKADDLASPFSSNVCNGMVTQGVVGIHVPEGAEVTLYLDGSECDADFGEISEPGTYVLQYQNNMGEKQRLFMFTIIGKSTGLIDSFTVPDGFKLMYVSKDDEPISIYGSTVSLKDEGEYSIGYRCANTGRDYTLNVTIDHTAPVLALSEIKDGKCWGPVDVSDLEEGVELTVIRDGEPDTYTNNTLTKSGNYTLILRDDAGNTTQYKFTIMIYLNIGSYIFFGVIGALLIGFVVYVLIAKRKLKVR